MSRTKKERKVKVGIVGCGCVATMDGPITSGYLPYLKDHSDIVAICDLYEERTKEIQRLFGAKERYKDYDEMLEKADIEVVFILTGPGTHASFTAKAAKAGKHVLVQKPFSTNMKDANDAVREVRRNKVKALVEPSNSSLLNPAYPQVKALIDKGVLGQQLWFTMDIGFGGTGKYGRRSHTGGATPYESHPVLGKDSSRYSREAGGKHFDATYSPALIATLLGPVKTVTGLAKVSVPNRFVSNAADYTSWLSSVEDTKGKSYWDMALQKERLTVPIKMEAEDNVFSLYEMANGALGCLHSSWCRFHPSPATPKGYMTPELQVYGLEGNFFLGGGHLASFISSKRSLLPSVDKDGWYHIPQQRGRWGYYHASAQHLFACILADKDPIPNVEWGRHVAEMMIGAVESSRIGKRYVMTTTF
jgi:predicted dehydrogenase